MTNKDKARFWKKVNKTGACWLWIGSKNGPYGVFGMQADQSYKMFYAHRIAYEILVGPIPEGMEVDHLCKIQRCVNPSHLEAVSPAENNRRSLSPSAVNIRKTHCKRGHPLAGDALYVAPNGSRQCRLCKRERWHDQKKEEAKIAAAA